MGETGPRDWDRVERRVWTERMLEALVKGVKGGVWYSLIDKIQRPETLNAAWIAVKRNGGSAGCDHQSVEDFEKDLAGEIERLSEALRTGTYRPRPIRRVYIDDKWVRRRLRSILRKRQGLHGISRGHDHYRWPNAYFRAHGLLSLVEAHRALVQSSWR